MHPRLPPPDDRLNIDALAQVFDDTAGSYKFLWFLAILDLLPDHCDGDCVQHCPALALRMLENAEEPLRRFRLSFGYHDRMAEYLKSAEEYAKFVDARNEGDSIKAARVLSKTTVYGKILAMGPLFLLSPFLPKHVNKKLKGVVHQYAKQLAEDGQPPLYYFSDNGKDVIIPAAWADYLNTNREIVRGWVLWHWARFLQSRNRNIPGVISKILKPSKGGLAAPRDFWKRVIQNEPEDARCIYTKEKLSQLLPNDFALDHFLPWEFVCHDNLWNLAPTFSGINMSKGARLPCEDTIGDLAKLHHLAIGVYHASLSDEQKYGREEMMLSYSADLGVSAHAATPSLGELQGAYMRVVPAWIALAKNRGFDDWVYDSKTEHPLIEE